MNKYYVVWAGRKPGIYTTWDECKAQVHKFPKAKYKSFLTLEDADDAFNKTAEHYITYPKKFYTSGKSVAPKRKPSVREPLPRVSFPKFPRP